MKLNAPMPAWARPQVEALIGPFHRVHTHRSGAGRTGVWELERDGQRFFFKTHNRRYKWGCEVYAYRSWARAFAPYLAELIGVFDAPDHFGLLLRGVVGRPLREADVPEAAAIEVYRVVGACLRRLFDSYREPWPWFGCAVAEDGAPLSGAQGLALNRPTDPVAIVAALWEDSERKAAQGAYLTPRQRQQLDALRPLTAAFAGERPMPVNSDFTPGNWLVSSEGRLVAVIDLEDMYYGLQIDPFIRLEADYFPANPHFREAFLEGFGEDLPRKLPHQVAVKLALHGLSFLIAGTERNDEDYRQRGERALQLAEQFARAGGIGSSRG